MRINGADAELMICEIINDVDDEQLAAILAIAIRKPVVVVEDDIFEIQ